MVAGVATIDAVIAVGINVLLEVLVRLHKCLGILEDILRMDVVVGQAVAEQQTSVEVLGAYQRIERIPRGVLSFSSVRISVSCPLT